MKEVAYANKVAVTTNLDEVTVIRQTRSTLNSVDIEEDDVIDLAVSFDGSSMTRGNKSLYGIGCVVDIVTGLVIDFVVLSMYCHRCACASARNGGTHTATFLQWKAYHRDCNIMYSGSSGGDGSC